MHAAVATRTTLGNDGLRKIEMCERSECVRPQRNTGSGAGLMWLTLQNGHVPALLLERNGGDQPANACATDDCCRHTLVLPILLL
jgi:hypothetical protein